METWMILVGAAAVIILIIVALWWRRIVREGDAITRRMNIYIRCSCGHPFIPKSGIHVQNCPQCGQLVNTSSATRFSQDNWNRTQRLKDQNNPENWLALGVKLADQKRYSEARKCFEMIEQMPDANPKTIEFARKMKQLIARKIS